MSDRDNDDDVLMVDDDEGSSEENKYLLFHTGAEIYGIGIMHVTDIIELQKITAVPDMPDYIKGVINLRGKVIPVMDLRLRFRMEPRLYDDRTCIIIINVDTMSIGLIVDTVSEVRDIPEKEIDPPPEFKSEHAVERYISGLGKVEGEVKILLDVNKLLMHEDRDYISSMDEARV
ncbi:MAG: purine-binding chemotaxis protein CheW [Spirochaetales bacterium]|nr:purine-binding chemotaxis protein CheW [Spirochaetales bacterium]